MVAVGSNIDIDTDIDIDTTSIDITDKAVDIVGIGIIGITVLHIHRWQRALYMLNKQANTCKQA